MWNRREVFESLRDRLGMFVMQSTYCAASSFVLGYDHAFQGGLLVGFREWLVVRSDGGNNLTWPALVLQIASVEGSLSGDLNPQLERRALDTLFSLLLEFCDVSSQRDGLERIFVEYAQWKAVESST